MLDQHRQLNSATARLRLGRFVVPVVIHYVDGLEERGWARQWPRFRADGVDWVEIDSVRIQSASAYWLYPEGETWVAGWGSFRYDPNPLTEIVISQDGQTERTREFAPDLLHEQIKLGWWWPGTSEPVNG